jgi:hypothetical protein
VFYVPHSEFDVIDNNVVYNRIVFKRKCLRKNEL